MARLDASTSAFLCAAALACSGCPEDTTRSPFDTGESTGDPTGAEETTASTESPTSITATDATTQTPSTSSTTDAPTTDASETDDESGSTAADGSTGPATTTGAAVCGDGSADGDEVCDGDDLVDGDCAGEGFDEGTLACSDDCTAYDTSACITYSCGNRVVEGKEECDGADLGGATCITEGFDAGTIACADNCVFDTSLCESFACPNNMIEGIEVCDGTDLAGQDCTTQGFDAGTLACENDCSAFDLSGCVAFMCPNNMAEGLEACDGTDVRGEDCVSQGFDEGTLGCMADCSAFDVSGCGYVCGNDMADGDEVCDGTDLGTATCVSQGFGGGTLGCLPGCDGYDTSACLAFPCEEENIGSALGVAVASGNSATDDNDGFTLSCGATANADHQVVFTAPATGAYAFDTRGSAIDTVIAVMSDCGNEIACSDDVSTTATHSLVALDLAAGQEVIVVIKPFAGASGNWQLNVSEVDIVNATGVPVAVPDDGYDGSLGSMGCATITAPDDGINVVHDARIRVGIDATWIGDLVVKLVSPDGTVTTLLSRPGAAEAADDGTDPPFGSGDNLVVTSPVTFRDPGDTDAESMGGSGDTNNVCQVDGLCDYAPNPGAATPGDFGDLSGEAANGTWQICVGDSAAQDATSLGSATLTLLTVD